LDRELELLNEEEIGEDENKKIEVEENGI